MSTPAGMPYRKRTIPAAVRREVALKYGCKPGETISVPCHYCGASGLIYWWKLTSGKPGSWVAFGHELDHVIPEFQGGPTTADNLVLACRPCNRTKGARTPERCDDLGRRHATA